MLNTLCPEKSDVDSSSGESTVSDKLYVLWLFEAQDNEIIDKLHILHSAQKKGMMRQLLLTACFWATVCGSYQLYMEDCPWTLLQELCWGHGYQKKREWKCWCKVLLNVKEESLR